MADGMAEPSWRGGKARFMRSPTGNDGLLRPKNDDGMPVAPFSRREKTVIALRTDSYRLAK